jgi:hypothetical protein
VSDVLIINIAVVVALLGAMLFLGVALVALSRIADHLHVIRHQLIALRVEHLPPHLRPDQTYLCGEPDNPEVNK